VSLPKIALFFPEFLSSLLFFQIKKRRADIKILTEKHELMGGISEPEIRVILRKAGIDTPRKTIAHDLDVLRKHGEIEPGLHQEQKECPRFIAVKK
jgi:hypothetical protein